MEKLIANSNILYVRASLRPLAGQIKLAGNVYNYLQSKIEFDEIFTPHFYGSRPFWRKRVSPELKKTNSGALGKSIGKLSGSSLSLHPSHAFVGLGPRISRELANHNENSKCFGPIGAISDQYDFSMLLIGCLEESPGFSTVHASQEKLGLTKLHLERYLLRWDYVENGNIKSKVAPESPGCSKSFSKFYESYRNDENLISGQWDNVNWIFIPSARKAMAVESEILKSNPRFVNCGNHKCSTCTLRLY
jgi:aminoglycoside 3-N-acetyltransferase